VNLHITNLANPLKQIIKKLDKPNHYDMIVGSLDRISYSLRLTGKEKYPIYQLLDDSSLTLFKSITKEQLVWIFADSEC